MENNDIFDSLVRERLQDAEVRAPRGTWASISSRIRPRHNAQQGFYLWGSLAGVCAAVALVLFVHRPVAQMPSESTFDVLRSESGVVGLAFEEKAVSGEIAALRSDLVPREAVSVIEQTVVPVSEEPVEEQVIKEEFETKEYAQEEKRSWNDPFAEMMEQDRITASKRKESISLKFGGSVGANDSHGSGNTFRPKWTSGYVSSDVNENSISSYSIPVSLGASARFPICGRLSVGVGLNWTMLNRYFEGSYKTAEGEVSNTLHYVGIPVSLYFNIVQKKGFQVYAYGGGSIEKCVSNKYFILSESALPVVSLKDDSCQFGLKVGFGGTFALSDLVSLYFDPYLGYYFSGSQPKSLRTEHPLMVSFEAGVRFNL